MLCSLRFVAPGALLGAFAIAPSAHAFSTRVHIMIANEVRDEIVRAADGSVELRQSPYSVLLDPEDVDAIVNHALEFRAGAVGPDNTAFPGMTDPSHAIEQRPFEQCQLLYEEAVLSEERAYALGCFLHGATDAVAHHYVNYMTGETFTLTPLSAARESSFENVVRHIVAESQIQKAAYTAKPGAFAGTALEHRIPKGFVLRAYYDVTSPLWQLMSTRAKAHYDAARAANPGGSLLTFITQADLAPADHLMLVPVYLDEVNATREGLRTTLASRIMDLGDTSTPDGATLAPTVGADGNLGTPDDDTACSFSCPTLYSTYYVYTSLLEPRYDAGNNPLPPAFDKLSDKLRDDLYGFLPAYMQVIENVSNKLNEPLGPASEHFSLSLGDVTSLFKPLDDWAANLTTIDYETLSQAALPGWIISIQNSLNLLGINVRVADIIQAIFEPFVQPIKDAIKAYAIDQVKTFLGDLVAEYKAKEAGILAEYDGVLLGARNPALTGTSLDHFYDSGLFVHSFNIAASAFANRSIVLPVGNHPVGIGPATFDSSHVPKWMQAGVCDYLREAIFPFGLDVKGALTVADGQTVLAATMTDDSPVECHDGSLTEFASGPTKDVCRLIDVAGLKLDPAHQGSVSRGYPPELDDVTVECVGLDVPGLPDPPPGVGGTGAAGAGSGGGAADAGTTAGGSAGTTASGATAGSSVAATPPNVSGDEGGCGCRVPSDRSRDLSWPALLLASFALGRRMRRARSP